jgi:hypothetical protein
VPLVLASGAGAEMRVALGVAVFSGMLGVTIFGIFFTPVFYVVIRWLSGQTAAGAVPAGKVPAPSPALSERVTAHVPGDGWPDGGKEAGAFTADPPVVHTEKGAVPPAPPSS